MIQTFRAAIVKFGRVITPILYNHQFSLLLAEADEASKDLFIRQGFSFDKTAHSPNRSSKTCQVVRLGSGFNSGAVQAKLEQSPLLCVHLEVTIRTEHDCKELLQLFSLNFPSIKCCSVTWRDPISLNNQLLADHWATILPQLSHLVILSFCLTCMFPQEISAMGWLTGLGANRSLHTIRLVNVNISTDRVITELAQNPLLANLNIIYGDEDSAASAKFSSPAAHAKRILGEHKS